MFLLGTLDTMGDGVRPDQQQSFYWFEQAAERGHAASKTIMGGRYEQGIGVELDLKKAEFWFDKACQGGLDFACRKLDEFREKHGRQAALADAGFGTDLDSGLSGVYSFSQWAPGPPAGAPFAAALRHAL